MKRDDDVTQRSAGIVNTKSSVAQIYLYDEEFYIVKFSGNTAGNTGLRTAKYIPNDFMNT